MMSLNVAFNMHRCMSNMEGGVAHILSSELDHSSRKHVKEDIVLFCFLGFSTKIRQN